MQQPSKQQLMLHLLEDAWVYVHLDPRRSGVLLPEHLKQEKRLALQYGYNMPVPIDNFDVDERGITATLSFRRVPHATFIPWEAVFALSDGDKRTCVWQEDLPADLTMEGEVEPARPASISSIRSIGTGNAGTAGNAATLGNAGTSGSAAPTPAEAAAADDAGPTDAAARPEPPTPPAKPGKKPRPSYLKLVD